MSQLSFMFHDAAHEFLQRYQNKGDGFCKMMENKCVFDHIVTGDEPGFHIQTPKRSRS